MEKCTSILRNNLPVSRYAPSKNMPQLARYLQINTARDATPTKYDYALVLNGEDIETTPLYGEVQPKKNVTLFGTHNEKDFGVVG